MRSDGANRDVLKTITHDQVGDQFDQYTTFTWAVKCEAVTALQLSGRATHLVSAAATGTSGDSAGTRVTWTGLGAGMGTR